MKKKVPNLLGFIIFSAIVHIFIIFILALHTKNAVQKATFEVSLIQFNQSEKTAEKQIKVSENFIENRNSDNAVQVPQEEQQGSSEEKGLPVQTVVNGLSNAQKEDFFLSYFELIQNKIEKNRKYPPDAVSKNQEGTAYVKFTITPNGDVSEISLVKSSGYDNLDKAAIAMVKDSNPFPSLPQETALSVKLPITFKLNR